MIHSSNDHGNFDGMGADDTRQGDARGPYAPFDLELDPNVFGLVGDVVETQFGNMRVVRSATRESDSVTLFIHGMGSSWTTWTPLLTAAHELGRLATDVVLVDLPGFGRSENRLNRL